MKASTASARIGRLLTLRALLAVVAGLAASLGGWTRVGAVGLPQTGFDPELCANGRIMQSPYGARQKSSHPAVAGCLACDRDRVHEAMAQAARQLSAQRAGRAQRL